MILGSCVPAIGADKRRDQVLRAGFLVYPGNAFAPAQLGQHVVRAEAVKAQQDQRVKPQVCRFAHDVQFITVLGRQQSLGRSPPRSS